MKIPKKTFATFCIVLLLTIPLYVTSVFGATVETACNDRIENLESRIDEINDWIEALSKIALISFTVYTVVKTISLLLSGIAGIFDCLCATNIPLLAWSCAIGEIVNKAKVAVDTATAGWLIPVSCFLTDGFCGNCGKQFSTNEQSGAAGGVGGNLANAYGGLDPFSSWVSSVLCVSLTGMIHNAKKYLNILQAHQCCLENACDASSTTMSQISTCIDSHEYNICVFINGGILTVFSQIISAFISRLTSQLVTKASEWLVKHTAPWVSAFLACPAAVYQISLIPQQMDAVQEKYNTLLEDYDSSDCDTLNIAAGIDMTSEAWASQDAFDSFALRQYGYQVDLQARATDRLNERLDSWLESQNPTAPTPQTEAAATKANTKAQRAFNADMQRISKLRGTSDSERTALTSAAVDANLAAADAAADATTAAIAAAIAEVRAEAATENPGNTQLATAAAAARAEAAATAAAAAARAEAAATAAAETASANANIDAQVAAIASALQDTALEEVAAENPIRDLETEIDNEATAEAARNAREAAAAAALDELSGFDAYNDWYDETYPDGAWGNLQDRGSTLQGTSAQTDAAARAFGNAVGGYLASEFNQVVNEAIQEVCYTLVYGEDD